MKLIMLIFLLLTSCAAQEKSCKVIDKDVWDYYDLSDKQIMKYYLYSTGNCLIIRSNGQ